MSNTPGDASTLNEEHRSISLQAVDVAQAEQDFNALSRQLTQHSLRKAQSTATRTASDVEKADGEADEPFDLRDYLSSSNDAQQQAGIKVRVLVDVHNDNPCSSLHSIA